MNLLFDKTLVQNTASGITLGGFHFKADSWHSKMDKFKSGFDPQIFSLMSTLMFEI